MLMESSSGALTNRLRFPCRLRINSANACCLEHSHLFQLIKMGDDIKQRIRSSPPLIFARILPRADFGSMSRLSRQFKRKHRFQTFLLLLIPLSYSFIKNIKHSYVIVAM